MSRNICIFRRKSAGIGTSLKKLGDGQLRAFRHIFDEFDIKNTGTITAEELHQIVKQIAGYDALSFSEVMEILNGMDVKGTGDIEFDEFIYFMTRPQVRKMIFGTNFDQNFDISIKFRLLQRSGQICPKFGFLPNISIFDQKFEFRPNFRFLTDISIVDQNFDFRPKF